MLACLLIYLREASRFASTPQRTYGGDVGEIDGRYGGDTGQHAAAHRGEVVTRQHEQRAIDEAAALRLGSETVGLVTVRVRDRGRVRARARARVRARTRARGRGRGRVGLLLVEVQRVQHAAGLAHAGGAERDAAPG